MRIGIRFTPSIFKARKTQAKGIVLPRNFFDGALEVRLLHPFSYLEEEGLIVVMRVREILLKKPPLNRSERDVSRWSLLGCWPRPERASRDSKFSYGLICKQKFRRELKAFTSR